MKHKHSPEEIHAAGALIVQLAERWPKCFSVFERRRRPLKLKIHLDILAALDGAVTPAELSLAMALYTHNSWYLRAAMRRGADRVDLEGNPVGTVTERDILNAAQELAHRAARRERQVQAAIPAVAPSAIPEPAAMAPTTAPTVAQPKRLTLSDLREAGRLRRLKERQGAEAS
jgi:ProP effector